MSKQIYNWRKVVAGDIISFRYKSKKSISGVLQTVLVFNPRLPVTRKDGTKTFHLVGLKLESRGNIPTITNKPLLVELLETIGDLSVIDEDSGIYRVLIREIGSRGVRPTVYKRIQRDLKKFTIYRTYDYVQARKSQVFLEPIVLPKNVREALIEN